ncbi:peroxisomal membrane anchor protein conserved region-domain-containing protein [Lophiotrema nucula]|uniref:Peroxisomal membrane protein PEX14 n=1 Tax=Lophiotrema nucula TaxID=690887 RepID=A0A6A5ZC31_9PLEO|nr:peroxisomal membrane anchor protein conserved region-domain-containing protein [Lophiotrema nucula]
MSNKAKIPPWQHAPTPPPDVSAIAQESKSETPAETEAPSADEAASNGSQSGDVSLLEQASRFLEDSTIRDAPREKKVAFLQSKGVATEEIEKLLGQETRNEDAINISEAGEKAWTKKAPQAPPAPPTIASKKDLPPIVTYPEFLTKAEKPPPLITTQRLLNTAYITGGLMASMYGLSKYIIAPMTQNLTESRHDFASHASEQLGEFNQRLEGAVSTDPASKPKKILDAADDISEADSDPTELYHRDFGTQTTPTLSRRPSVSSTSEVEKSVVTGHEDRLKIIASHLKELEASRNNDYASSDSLRTKLSDLTTYLGEMSYQNQYYSNIGGIYSSNYGLPKTKDGKDDQIEVLKADIRAVKGVFLSARNFPAGGRNSPRVGG